MECLAIECTELAAFWLGLAGGVVFGMLLLCLWCKSHADYIEAKAKPEHRTPMCVRGRCYYVVPEEEYNGLNNPKIRAKMAGRRVRPVYPIDPEDCE